jgi:hypothetical protein
MTDLRFDARSAAVSVGVDGVVADDDDDDGGDDDDDGCVAVDVDASAVSDVVDDDGLVFAAVVHDKTQRLQEQEEKIRTAITCR